LADAADATHPTPCPTCGANEAGLWLKNPPADPATPSPIAPGSGTHPTQHSYILEEDQPQPCPECGEKRVRGVNGSQRWCIGCGANWPTADAFLADVAAAEPVTTRRAELTRRFTEVVRHLSPSQLSEVETVIMRLEKQGSQ
jgi:ribosomal protein L37AE/L43A